MLLLFVISLVYSADCTGGLLLDVLNHVIKGSPKSMNNLILKQLFYELNNKIITFFTTQPFYFVKIMNIKIL